MFRSISMVVPQPNTQFLNITHEQLKTAFLAILDSASSDAADYAELVLQKTLGIPVLVKTIAEKVDQHFPQGKIASLEEAARLKTVIEAVDTAKDLDKIISEAFALLSFPEKRILFFICILNPHAPTITKLSGICPRYAEMIPDILKKLQEERWIELDMEGRITLVNLRSLPEKIVPLSNSVAEATEKSRLSLEHIFSQLPVGLAVFDEKGGLEFANIAHDAIAPSKPGDSSWREFIHPDDRLLLERGLKQARSGIQHSDVRFKQGEKITWTSAYITYEPYTDKFIGVLVDITPQKELELKLHEQERKLQEKTEEHRQQSDSLLHDVCHTLKNQLHGLRLCIEVLQVTSREFRDKSSLGGVSPISASLTESLATLDSTISDLDRIYKALETITLFELDVFKLKSGTPMLACEPIDLAVVHRRLNLIFNQAATKKRLSFTSCWEGERIIKSDLKRVESLLTNLVENAIKYTDTGTIEVSIRANPDTHYLTFCVRDTGRGMSEDFITRKLFHQFARETQDRAGYGIGLSRCKTIVEAMHGTIRAESELGKGSVFTIEIPYQSLSKEEASDFVIDEKTEVADRSPRALMLNVPQVLFRTQPPSPSSLTGATGAFSLRGLKILIVDDDDLNRDLLSRLLSKAGADVITAENGKIGIGRVSMDDPDVIIMDIQMPILDGIKAARYLRSIFAGLKEANPTAKIPIIIAASGDALQCHEGTADLFDAYLPKPCSPKTMINQILSLRKSDGLTRSPDRSSI